MEYTPQEVAKLLANRPHQPHYVEWLLEQVVAAERERWERGLRLAGWFYEVPSAMTYRLWEQGHEDEPNMVALYERPNAELSGPQRPAPTCKEH